MRVMIFNAYCVTSVVLDSQIVNPIADNTVRTATPIGNNAAIIVPKTIPRIINVRGAEITSALIRSSCMRVSNVTSMATAPVLQSSKSESISIDS